MIYGICMRTHDPHGPLSIFLTFTTNLFLFRSWCNIWSLVVKSLTKAKTSSFLTSILCLFHIFHSSLCVLWIYTYTCPWWSTGHYNSLFCSWYLSQLVQLLHMSSKLGGQILRKCFSCSCCLISICYCLDVPTARTAEDMLSLNIVLPPKPVYLTNVVYSVGKGY